MDNFMDKLTAKLSAQEMIKANSAAEAAESERLRSQVKQYQMEISELTDIKKSVAELEEKLQSKIGSSDISGEKTYRAVTDLNSKIDELILAQSDEIKEVVAVLNEKPSQDSDIEKLIAASDEKTYSVGVQTYRNIQASNAKDIEKQTKELKEAISESFDRNGDEDGDYGKCLGKLKEQIDEIDRKLEALRVDVDSKKRGAIPLLVFILLWVIGGVVLNALWIFGLI